MRRHDDDGGTGDGRDHLGELMTLICVKGRYPLIEYKGEHGIGLGKKVSSLSGSLLVYDADTVITKHCLLKELGPSAIGVMKAMKDTLDPQ